MTSDTYNASLLLLRKLEGFCTILDTDKALLAEICATAQTVDPATDLIREGDAPAGVFLILEGFAYRYKRRADGSRQIMAYLVPGDLGDLDVALFRRMDHSIATFSACQVVLISTETIQELMQRPSLASALRMGTLVDEATAREWLVNVGRRTATERIAHILCELFERLRIVGLVHEDSFDLPLTHSDLADTAGLTKVHVTRALQELRERGLIDLTGCRMTIRDHTGLRSVAEFKSNYLHLGDEAVA